MLSKKQFAVLAVLVILSGFAGGILSGLLFSAKVVRAEATPGNQVGKYSVPTIMVYPDSGQATIYSSQIAAVPVYVVNQKK